MTNSYCIHSNLGFIGFCFILANNQSKTSTIALFETIVDDSKTVVFPSITLNKVFKLDTDDISIINELMVSIIPSYKQNGMVYSAYNSENVLFNL